MRFFFNTVTCELSLFDYLVPTFCPPFAKSNSIKLANAIAFEQKQKIFWINDFIHETKEPENGETSKQIRKEFIEINYYNTFGKKIKLDENDFGKIIES